MDLLITPDEIFRISFVGEDNMKPDRIPDSVIKSSQEKYLRPVLGTLLDKLSETNYTSFVNDFLKEPLAFYVRYMILPSLSIQLTNMGAFISETDYSRGATDRQRDTLRQSALTIAEPLMYLAIKYIESHLSEFPDYVRSKNNNNKIKGGIIL